MKIQAELWDRLDLLFDELLYQPPDRLTEIQDLHWELCDRFADTLTDKQREAFSSLSGINESLKVDIADYGLAMGIRLAGELTRLMANPEKALRESYTSVRKPVRIEEEKHIRILEEYFKDVTL